MAVIDGLGPTSQQLSHCTEGEALCTPERESTSAFAQRALRLGGELLPCVQNTFLFKAFLHMEAVFDDLMNRGQVWSGRIYCACRVVMIY